MAKGQELFEYSCSENNRCEERQLRGGGRSEDEREVMLR